MNKAILFAIGLGSVAPLASGQVFLNTLGNTLFRTTGGSTDTFMLSADLTSMAVNPVTGEIFGSARTDADNDGFFELYRLDDPEGTPSLTLVGDFLTENTPTLSFVENNRLLGVQTAPGSGVDGALIEIDLGGMSQMTLDADIASRPAGSGYDATSNTLYALEGGSAAVAALYSVPFNDADVVSSFIGLTNQQTVNTAGEFFGGTLYQAVNITGGDLLVGSINTATGEFTQLFSLGTSTNEPTALAVIPAPGVAGLFGLAGVASLRRRR